MDEYYITQDLYLASTLVVLGFILDEITEENGKFSFHFVDVKPVQKVDPLFTAAPDEHSASAAAEEYWIGNLLVSPRDLFTEFKSIKGRMYDLKRRQK